MGSFSQLSVQLSQIRSWKLALVGAFIPQKSANTTNQSSPTPRQPFASSPLPVEHVSGVLRWRAGLPEAHMSHSPTPGDRTLGEKVHSGRGTNVHTARAPRELQTEERGNRWGWDAGRPV